MRLSSCGVLVWNADLQFYLHLLDQFHALFLKKYAPKTLRDRKKDELQLVTNEEDRIRLFIKRLNSELQVLSIHLTSVGRILMR